MTPLELLAPARTTDIGIAAIDCGADAVYIAGPAFGARQAAGNSVEDIARLCAYARPFGVRIFVTLNTILYDDELDAARDLLAAVAAAGVDGVIAQDAAVRSIAPPGMVLHASTQCAIRTPERARFLESLGYGRLVLERALSLKEIRTIAGAVDAEIECFVHGALCVCYSGQCYLSEHLAGRSANRGACIQACRSRYDLIDGEGHVLVRDKALLSLKDYNLLHRLADLADAGVSSFKIEGRLKNASYVRNTVRAYSEALDAVVAAHPGRYRRASWGRVTGGFTPDLDKTFNRGYTTLWLDGRRGPWAAMDAPKSMGEYIGTAARIAGDRITVAPVRPGMTLRNGDGFAFTARDGAVIGFRGDVCEGLTIRGKAVPELYPGARLYRNVSADFERTMDRQPCTRLIGVTVTVDGTAGTATAVSEDGRTATAPLPSGRAAATNPERMTALLHAQLGRRTGHYAFCTGAVAGPLPHLSLSDINGLRRTFAAALDRTACHRHPLYAGEERPDIPAPPQPDYRENIANALAAACYRARDAADPEPAYERTHRPDAELMRTRYCIRYELGRCPKYQGAAPTGPLYLRNNGRRLALGFDCTACEMTVRSLEG